MANRKCSVDGCTATNVVARGWCRNHYQRWSRHGDPLAGRPPKPPKAGPRLPATSSFEDRFWQKVEKTPSCWLWIGALNEKGYGLVRHEGKTRTAHRVAWELAGRQLIDGLQLDHLCRTRRCVRVDHLDQVTSRVNTMRGETIAAANAAKTHCPAGHEYTPENTYVWPGAPTASRQCRTCQRT